MTLNQFITTHQPDDFQKTFYKRMGLRYGQWLFNELYEHNEKLGDEIRGTSSDPFYNDSRIPAFWQTIGSKWE